MFDFEFMLATGDGGLALFWGLGGGWGWGCEGLEGFLVVLELALGG